LFKGIKIGNAMTVIPKSFMKYRRDFKRIGRAEKRLLAASTKDLKATTKSLKHFKHKLVFLILT